MMMAVIACEKEDDKTPVLGVNLNKRELAIEIGDTAHLKAIVLPEDATDQSITWESTMSAVATVSETGVITALSEGTTIVSVKTVDGGFQAECYVTVVPEPIHLTGITLNVTADTLDINCTLQLIATIEPGDATDQSVIWTSSDASVASVSNSGLVTALAGGQTTITATTNDGRFTATCEIWIRGVGTISEVMTRGFLETAGAKVGVDITTDASGIPYIALNAYDVTLSGDTKASAEVWRLGSGNNWTQFAGQVAITNDESFAPSIAIKDDGDVYIAYEYYNDDSDIRYDNNVVSYSSGGSWACLGGETSASLIKNGSTPLSGGSELAFKADGTLLIAQVSYGDGYVHYYNGSTWNSYNGYKTDSENFWAGGIDIACDGNTPYVSLRTSSGDGKTGVLYGNEANGITGQWNWLGGTYANPSNHDAQFQDAMISEASLAINSQGDVFTAYYSYSSPDNPIVVKKFADGASGWETIYSQDASSIQQVEVLVANDVLYLLIANNDDGIDIWKLNECGVWIYEGKTAKPDTYYNIKTVEGTDGQFFIAYECTYSLNGQVGVYKYTPYSLNK